MLTQTLSWRVGFFLNVPVGLAAILAAPHVPRRDPPASRALGPLRLFASPERAGAYAARFLFNGTLLSFFFLMTQYLQGVSGDSPLEAGLAFLPVTAAAFAAAAIIPRLTRRASNAVLSVAGCAAMLIGTAWLSRVSLDTRYLTGIALPMVAFGIGQGLGLSALTTAGMAGVAPEDARRCGRAWSTSPTTSAARSASASSSPSSPPPAPTPAPARTAPATSSPNASRPRSPPARRSSCWPSPSR